MKHTMTTLGALMTWTTPVWATGGMETEGTGLITILFIVFGTLIVVGQLIPALVILGGMVKGLLGKTRPVADHK